MSCNHNNKDCRLDMSRGCVFCGGHGNDQSNGTGDGSEIGVQVCEGCFKLHETDWLASYPDAAPSDIFEVRFKNTR
ncbi:MAG: hypothetical protein LBU97_02460, partial [Alistipes sp.]|nr:hypothetical protein [Alistipes sp.]